ncbi:hypothetical protein A3K34_01955 [candidate division WWE3 bacterium RIFOXYC1_FULL_40_10]|uniref:ATP-grasp domain-containing protein n=1 Tax=candidate division WWE3 bacterium RIFOXYA2_FULL_46_9 TaxID=1802636 RepID=A0A1F4VZZ6_UNCKA|nr:MAG: hypothetical protein A3K58_01955 [candidate division WWE3 bacterium RIFOXYB1_FULL_40_22]OGC61625.1 MAG: hypothetical protein A3K37_01955 [candidate division WWE3 bacterium RIFOXYA1_FULL_40_11]OGC62670.1 MAG: hypothetical protein A2264_02260 [candidate division WWE3 bacterium RIFOXYA2_FULL_46_9]OGC64698.1 MAG: hypothetical protein A2326_01490 [candidate division WWE3 bacterium RIFOXYB2_FULL_41_6]OGC66008.1 MAG: hypothetical protein A3K34_01955 [candidate division WWE3 bacterium RIFOXYC1_
MESTNGQSIIEFKLPSRVGIIYSDAKPEYFPTEQQYLTEKDSFTNAQVIADELKILNIDSILYPGNESLTESLRRDKPEMIFNLVDSVRGNEYLSSTIPGILEMLDIPYAGAGIIGFALCYNKFLTKQLLKAAGIPVPNCQLFVTPNDQIDLGLRFPIISKLNEIHGAVEITKSAVSENEKELRERLKYLIDTYKQPVVAEEFIVGREIAIIVIEGQNRKVYMGEKVFNKPDDKYVFATFEDQWYESISEPFTYARFDDEKLRNYARRAFDLTKMADYGKFDVRMDASGRYYFIDVNANPAFGPKRLQTSMGYIVQDLYGVTFSDILKRLMINTLYGN